MGIASRYAFTLASSASLWQHTGSSCWWKSVPTAHRFAWQHYMLPGTVNNGFWGVARLVPLHVLSVSLLAAVHMRRHAGAHPLHLSCLMTVLGLCSLLSS